MRPITAYVRMNTILKDSTTGIQSLNQCVLITKKDLFSGSLFTVVSQSTYVDSVDAALFPVEFKWLQTLFSQTPSPETATILFWDTGKTISEVLQEAMSFDVPMYFLHYGGTEHADIEDQLAIAEASISLSDRFMCSFLTTDDKVANSTDSTDIASRLGLLAAANCFVTYQPLTTQTHQNGIFEVLDTSKIRPDAAMTGRMSTSNFEGKEQWAFKALAGVIDSSLTPDQIATLERKRCNFVVRVKRSNFNFNHIGRTVTGREIRVHWAIDWFDLTCQAEIFNYMCATDAVLRHRDTYAQIESILRTQMNRLSEERKVIFENFTIKLPDPMLYITQAEIVSGLANLYNCYEAIVVSAIEKFNITGSFYLVDRRPV